MQTRTKVFIAAASALVVGGLALAGPSLAQHMQRGRMGMMGNFGAQQLLRAVDTDRDGRISQAEVDAAVQARFAQFDADKNGRLSLDEFTALWADLTRPVAVRAFQFLDPNGDAGITEAEADEQLGMLARRFDHVRAIRQDRDGPGRDGPGRDGRDRDGRDTGPRDPT